MSTQVFHSIVDKTGGVHFIDIRRIKHAMHLGSFVTFYWADTSQYEMTSTQMEVGPDFDLAAWFATAAGGSAS